jgi:hypothetical protein
MADSILEMLLAEAGCPYQGDTIDAVIWLHGFRAGRERGRRDTELDRRPPMIVDQPPARRPGRAKVV